MKLYITTDYAKLDGVIDLVTDRKDGEFAFNTLKNSKEWNKSELYLFEIDFSEKIYDYDRDEWKIEFYRKDNKEKVDNSKILINLYSFIRVRKLLSNNQK